MSDVKGIKASVQSIDVIHAEIESNLQKVRYETKTADDELTFNSIKDKKLTPEQVFISKQRQKRITNAINELKPKFKEVIIMYEIEGKSYEEISNKLNCPIGTIKSRIYNAKKELYEKLKDLV